MFKNRKLEVRLVKDDAAANNAAAPEKTRPDYVAIAEEATKRIGVKILVGAVAAVAAVAVIHVLANAADTALQNAINE